MVQFDINITKYDDSSIAESFIPQPYDTTSSLYTENTKATAWAQSSNPDIISQSVTIVGNETNPYNKAKLIHEWVAKNISNPPEGPLFEFDALSTLQEGWGDCAGKANLFVALCRAAGVPARNISGIQAPNFSTFQSGEWYWPDVPFHTWTEFYIEGYGWVENDPTSFSRFAKLLQERIITAKGNDIIIGNGNTCSDHTTMSGTRSYFHIPLSPCQDNVDLALKVETLSEIAPTVIPEQGIWKSDDNLVSAYLQIYETGSAIIVITMDGKDYAAFLDPDISDGFQASDDIESHGYYLEFMQSTSTDTVIQTNWSNVGEKVINLKFPAQLVGFGGIWEITGSPFKFYLQSYEALSCVMIWTFDGNKYWAWLDSDYSDGIDCSDDFGSQGASVGLSFVDNSNGQLTINISDLQPGYNINEINRPVGSVFSATP